MTLKLPNGTVSYRKADRRLGYFFNLAWDHTYPDAFLSDGVHAKLVFDPKHRLEVAFWSGDQTAPDVNDPRCRQFPDIQHFVTQNFETVSVRYGSSDFSHELEDGPVFRDGLVYCPETGYHFIGRPLLDTLLSKGVSGLVVSKVVQHQEFCGDWLRDDEIVMIDGRCSPFTHQVILPEEANRCEHCGYAPLMCPECGRVKLYNWDFSALCWKCGKTWLLSSDAPKSEKQEMRIQDADPFPEPFVDMARWDGSDFNTGMLVTRRVVNLFERLKCGSFRAEPVAVDVTGLTDEQWQRLEASREPC